MSFSKQNDEIEKRIGISLLMLTLAAIVTAIITFLLGISNLDFLPKIFLFLVILIIEAVVCGVLFNKIRRAANVDLSEAEPAETTGGNLSFEIQNKLKSLNDAGALTGATLGINDSVRFVGRRIEDIFNFSNIVLVVPESKENLKIVQAQGNKAAEFLSVGRLLSRGIAGRALTSGKPEIDRQLELEQTLLDERLFDNLKTAAAVPLREQNGEVFGAMILYGDEANGFDETDAEALKQLAETVSPIFKNALNYERSVENALTDPVTNLPNDRAFYLILENQLAESQRSRETRPLTVLAADVYHSGNNDSGNNELSVNEKTLDAAARILKEQLREMDFVARHGGNEFAVILPTATPEIAEEIIRRIVQAAEQETEKSADEEKIAFNFGAATFYQDGETGHELYQAALIKKDQSKRGDKSVVWFNKK